MVECVCVSIKEVFRVGISNDPECVKFLTFENGLFGVLWIGCNHLISTR